MKLKMSQSQNIQFNIKKKNIEQTCWHYLEQQNVDQNRFNPEHSFQQIKSHQMPKRGKKKGLSPSFINILLKIIGDSKNQDAIRWSQDGDSIVIDDFTKLANQTLPYFFKHNNVTSFIRQLNIYHFHKTSKGSELSLYSHPFFKRGKERMCQKIQRKMRKKSDDSYSLTAKEDQVNQIKQNMDQLVKKQQILRAQNQDLTNERDELAELLKKTQKQYEQFFNHQKKNINQSQLQQINEKQENQLSLSQLSNFKKFVSILINSREQK